MKTPLVIERRFFYYVFMSYRLSDSGSSGDIELAAENESLEGLFADAARGLTEIIVDISDLRSDRRISLEVDGENLEELFFNWLSEIIYLKDVDNFLLKDCRVSFSDGQKRSLKGDLEGDDIDPDRQNLKIDVKAVTLYNLKVEKKDNHWHGEVVFDL